MNPTDPLAQLHPLREPGAIGWWPPAPGWWVLLLVLLSATAALLAWLWLRHRRNRYRRLGLAQLREVEQRYRTDGDSLALAAAVNALLKTVALQAYPRTDVAGIHGQAWADFLNSTGGQAVSFDNSMAAAHYLPASDAPEPAQLCDQASLWIRQHRRQP